MDPKAPQDDQYWIEEFRKGNSKALTYFFQLHAKSLNYFAKGLIQDEAESQDVVSDCFIKLWQRHQEFKTVQNIKAFLYISCRNACLNYLDHLKVKTTVQKKIIKELEEGEETILIDIINAEVLGLLAKEIEGLPGKCREVFRLIYFDHKDTGEIAEALELSVKTVRNYKAKAVELLKTSFLKQGISGSAYLAFLIYMNRL
jgi:RNA polymerase sigma-70 factor (family 1)